MLLQNRNAFGHAFIKDIAGNAGDKPLQPTFPRSKQTENWLRAAIYVHGFANSLFRCVGNSSNYHLD
jgi:hypothetical protein